MKPITTISGLSYRSLVAYLPSHLAVLLAAATTTAVLTGALILGDSLRFSLRQRAMDRLGDIDWVLRAPHLFRQSWADEVTEIEEFRRCFSHTAIVLHIQTVLEKPGDAPRVVNRVQLFGCDARFWAMGSGQPQHIPRAREIVLNQTLANRLKAKVGDRLTLRIPQLQGIPSESALGRRHDLVRPFAVTVADIVPDVSLGAFSLNLSQEIPCNAYVNLGWLASATGQPGKANLLLLKTANNSSHSSEEAERVLGNLLLPPEDYGVRIERTAKGYVNITTDRLIFQPSIEEHIVKRLQGVSFERVTVFLAETVRAGAKEAWYVTMAAMPLAKEPPLGPFLSTEGRVVSQPAVDQCVVNEWLASRLNLRPGDSLEVTWFTPETQRGQVERGKAILKVADIVSLRGAADDPALVPEVQGLTDRESIADWDPPFPFDASRVTKEDEQYWEQYRATPKIFVSPEFALKHWKSRFGTTTSIRVVPSAAIDVPQLIQKLTLPLSAIGWTPQPIRSQALQAAKGTTPFEWLFLGFSFFVIIAALLLTGLIFALTLERRRVQIGIVRATGWSPRHVLKWLNTEALFLSILAGAVGIIGGVAYAQLMLWALHTVWLPAIGTRFLTLFFRPESLITGFTFGVLSGLFATLLVIIRLSRRPPSVLLTGQTTDPHSRRAHNRLRLWSLRGVMVCLFLLAALLGIWGTIQGEQNQAGIFFLSGGLILLAFWLTLKLVLYHMDRSRRRIPSLAGLAIRNLSRNRARTELTVLLMAAAVFIIIAISAFYVDPAELVPHFNSGNGGFTLIGETDLPVFDDLNDPTVRDNLGLWPKELQMLNSARVFPFRVKSGDDASCLNLYRPQQPIILGVSTTFIERGGFTFTDYLRDENLANPWELLKKPPRLLADSRIVIPTILDDATAKYSLHLWRGVGDRLEIQTEDGKRVVYEIVGLLHNSIFQGRLLISEEAFLQVLPDTPGYRFFLVEYLPPPDKDGKSDRETWQSLASIFERILAELGASFTTTQNRLAALLAVQNTYLSTFQTLGGFGVLLGTVGLGAVVFRGLWERRREIGLLRAVGFRSRQIVYLVMSENLGLLITGLVIGAGAALVAISPQLATGRATIPYKSLLQMLMAMMAIGTLTAWIATHWLLRQNLIASLRRE